MTGFSPRTGAKGYIKRRNNKFFYRRTIPKAFRQFFENQYEWSILLTSTTDAARRAEALAIAHEHNTFMNGEVVSGFEMNGDGVEGMSLCLDLSPHKRPTDLMGVNFAPMQLHREGEIIETYKIAVSNNPDYLRSAEKNGFISATYSEMLVQVALGRNLIAAKVATGDKAEILDLKKDNIIREIDNLALVHGDTLETILPVMHEFLKQKDGARKKHYLAAAEFSELHGNLPIVSITKAHVSAYVSHMGGKIFKGKLLAPTTVKQRLDSIAAIIQYAVSKDVVAYNVAKGVAVPKDNRPLGAKTYKPFSPAEIRNLVGTATTIWNERKYNTPKTQLSRSRDFIVTLHMLVWTGARPEEICQLRTGDIDLARDAIIITNVSDEIDHLPRSTKNETSVRVVPIHTKLLSIVKDHHDYITTVSSDGLLFPSFAPDLDTGRYARPISYDWSKVLREHVTNDPQKVLYSLRHSWASESRRPHVDMPEWVRNSIMGHTNKESSGSAGRYGNHFDNLETKAMYVEKMNCIGDIDQVPN